MSRDRGVAISSNKPVLLTGAARPQQTGRSLGGRTRGGGRSSPCPHLASAP
jgi:hypothetical protein